MKINQFLPVTLIVLVGLIPVVWAGILKKSTEIGNINEEVFADDDFNDEFYIDDYAHPDMFQEGGYEIATNERDISTTPPLSTSASTQMDEEDTTPTTMEYVLHGCLVIGVGVVCLVALVAICMAISLMMVMCAFVVDSYGSNDAPNPVARVNVPISAPYYSNSIRKHQPGCGNTLQYANPLGCVVFCGKVPEKV